MATATFNPRYISVSRRRFLKGAAAGGAAAAILACGGAGDGGSSLTLSTEDSRKPGGGLVRRQRLEAGGRDQGGRQGRHLPRRLAPTDQAGNYDAMTHGAFQVPFSGHVHEYLMGRNRGPGIDPASREAAVPGAGAG